MRRKCRLVPALRLGNLGYGKVEELSNVALGSRVLLGGERDFGNPAKADLLCSADMVSKPPANDAKKVETFIAGGDNG